MRHRILLGLSVIAALGIAATLATTIGAREAAACGIDPTNRCNARTQSCDAACTPLPCAQRVANFDTPPAVGSSFFAGALDNCTNHGTRDAILACAWQQVVALAPEVAADACMKNGLFTSARTQQKLGVVMSISRNFKTVPFTSSGDCATRDNGFGTRQWSANLPPGYFAPSAPPELLDWQPPRGRACTSLLLTLSKLGVPCVPQPTPAMLNNPIAHNIGADEGRLRSDLRAAARARNPRACALPLAAVHFARQTAADDRLARAYADLAVTGHLAFDQFRRAPPDEAYCRQIVLPPPGPACPGVRDRPPSDALLVGCRKALDRAYAVANALRAGQGARAAAGLGWIAVSGEDDSPHRPVNVPESKFPQFDLTVSVPTPLVNWPARTPRGASVDVRTRYTIAQSRAPAMARRPVRGWTLASDPEPSIAPDSDVILFIHGMDSRAEESDEFTGALFKRLADQRITRNVVVISLDLPSSGYADNIDYTKVSPLEAIGRPKLTPLPVPVHIPPGLDALFLTVFVAAGLPPPPPVIPAGVPIPDFAATGKTPLLDFIEEFIVNVVGALDRDPRLQIKSKLEAVMGGSLGGNMAFRLGRRPGTPWLPNVIVWSPASIWDSLGEGADITKHLGPRAAWSRADKPPGDGDRQEFFGGWDMPAVPLLVPMAQSDTWQSDFYPCKKSSVASARLDRQETYDASFLRWHWRLGGEQLLYSHQSTVAPENATAADPLTHQPRYRSNTKRMLLACGTEDNVRYNEICNATQKTAPHMSMTPGKAIFLQMTGHSVDTERRTFFANEVAEFLGYVAPPALAAVGAPCTNNASCVSNRCDAAGPNAHRCIPNDGAGGQGDYCSHDNQCVNRSCVDARCETALGLGQSCHSNAGCLSGRCDAAGRNARRCIPHDGAGQVGDYCSHNNHCSNRNCGLGTNQQCNAAAALGLPCQSNAGCASGRCDAAGNNAHRCIPNDGTGARATTAPTRTTAATGTASASAASRACPSGNRAAATPPACRGDATASRGTRTTASRAIFGATPAITARTTTIACAAIAAMSRQAGAMGPARDASPPSRAVTTLA